MAELVKARALVLHLLGAQIARRPNNAIPANATRAHELCHGSSSAISQPASGTDRSFREICCLSTFRTV